jgi:hypothetical protein
METFIIRVYRRSRSRTGAITGLVETVGTDEKRAFQTFSGLINSLRNTIFPVSTGITNTIDSDTYSASDENRPVEFRIR